MRIRLKKRYNVEKGNGNTTGQKDFLLKSKNPAIPAGFSSFP